MPLSDRVRRTIHEHAMARNGDRVIVALSGGPDSVALTHLLRELEGHGDLVVAGLAHFHHQLRGADADEDEAFCRGMSAALGIPIEVGSADVGRIAREKGRSIEDVARELRYRFLGEAADRFEADAIATGHTLDDQAETFLLRLIRGSASRGLAGILPRVGRIVRPLLEIRRSELREYARERGLGWREDATNADVSIPRNRVRHELIPYLESRFNTQIVDVLARHAGLARRDDDRLNAEAIDLASTIVLTTKTGNIEIDAVALRSLDPALSSRVVHHALSQAAGGRFVGSDQVTRLLDLVAEPVGAAADLPGQRAIRQSTAIVLGPPLPRIRGGRVDPANSFRFPLSIPGEVTLDNQEWTVSADRLESLDPPGGFGPARGVEVAIAADPLALPLAVRFRRDGDRFRPLGMDRGKKLQDFLVDRKIPREIRDSLPLVVDRNDRIVWVVGESVSEDFRVTEPARGVILLKARRLGGPG